MLGSLCRQLHPRMLMAQPVAPKARLVLAARLPDASPSSPVINALGGRRWCAAEGEKTEKTVKQGRGMGSRLYSFGAGFAVVSTLMFGVSLTQVMWSFEELSLVAQHAIDRQAAVEKRLSILERCR
mmetsp:Transcript_64931/g.113264  ORF Transcript_64931/g.113264 Transcript_64931/m.113264 type:complete len:126 (-) Transcript_64931:15-392(-)